MIARHLSVALIAWGGAVLVVAGCVPSDVADEDFAAVLPLQEDLEVRIGRNDVGAGEVNQALLDPFADCEECCIEGEGEAARYIDGELYFMTRSAKWHVNGGLIVAIGWIGTIVASPAVEAIEDGYIWGPWRENLSRVEYRLVMERAGEQLYLLRLEGKNINDPRGVWTTVLAGDVTSTGIAHRGYGRLVLDFDAIHALDSAHPSFTQGSIQYDFDVRELPYTVDVIFTNVALDSGEILSASYQYQRYAELAGYFRFEAAGDFVPEEAADGVNETLLVETQWTAEGEGIGSAVVTAGSLEAANVDSFELTECWADSVGLFYQTYSHQRVTYGDGTAPAEEVLCGDVSNCPSF